MHVTVTGAGKARVIQFVEQHRIPGTKRKKTVVIRTLGNYEAMLAENPNILEELRREAKRLTQEKKEKNAPVLLELANQEIRAPEDALGCVRFGHSLGAQLWKRMRLGECLTRHSQKKNLPSILKAIEGLLYHRISDPRSVLASVRDLSHYAGFGDIGLDVHYQCLEVLAQRQQAFIEHLSRFFEQHTRREGPAAFYDVTTYSFESVREGELRMFGFSKDHKHGEVQVVMGLLLDTDGIPITFTLFPGNTMDQQTLSQAVESLKTLYRLDKIVVVADRGLNGKDNLEMLLESGHDFVMGFTLKTASPALQEIALDPAGWEVSVTGDTGDVLVREKRVPHAWETKVLLSEEEKAALPKGRGRPRKYKKVTIDATLHVTWTRKRADKDRADRERLLKKTKEALKNPGKVKNGLKKGRNKYLTFTVDTEDMRLDEDRIERAELFDGIYVYITSDAHKTTGEICSLYGGLWQIEESFRVCKTDLRARPVFLWTDERIRGHFMLCFLALCMIRYLQVLLPRDEQTNERATTQEIRESFLEPSVVVIGESPLFKLLPLRVNQMYLDIAAILGLPPLQRVMSPSQFKQATKLDIGGNIQRIRGQRK